MIMKYLLIIFLVGVFVALASSRHVLIETEDTETRGKDGTSVGGHGNLDFCIIIFILNGRRYLPTYLNLLSLFILVCTVSYLNHVMFLLVRGPDHFPFWISVMY